MIAAVGKNGELGYKGKLCFNIPADMQFFKETTLKHDVIMGYNTYKSLPKPLPQRWNYVIANSIDDIRVFEDDKITPTGWLFLPNIDKVLYYWGNNVEDTREAFIIGGGYMYAQFIDKVKYIYLTEIDANAKADVFFPKFNKQDFTREVLGGGIYKGLSYTFVKYTRRAVNGSNSAMS